MRNHDPQLEAAFYERVDEFIDLEANTGRKYTDAEYNLDGIRRLADLFDHPENAMNIVHVAGTKGKGSTTAMIAAMLRNAGETTGAFTSPHLATVRERFAINGAPVGYPELLDTVDHVKSNIKAAALHPTFFEFATILALQLFKRAGCRWAVLETGIGGLLDCTNYVEAPECAVITAVSFDHTELLGKTIREIATQKAGIIKPDRPVVVSPQPYPETIEVMKQTARDRRAPIHFANFAKFPGFIRPLEPFQQENLATALTTCEVMKIPLPGFEFIPPRLPGRCECIRKQPLVMLDAAHNADSARRLAEALQGRFPHVRFHTVLGVAAGKDGEAMLRELAPVTDRFILTNPRPFKASGLRELILAAERLNLPHEVKPGIQATTDLPTDTPLLFTGSFFTAVIGEELFA